MKPTIAPELAAAAQMPLALLRSRFGNAAVSNESVAGMMNAAPDACHRSRHDDMDRTVDDRRGQRRNGKDRKPEKQCPRRRYRSPNAPAGNSRHASTSV